jgi:hypothetical protein
MALGVSGDSKTAGAPLEQAAAGATSSQVWQLAGDRSGLAVILNANSGQAISAQGGDAGSAVDQAAFDGGASLRWALEPVDGTFYRLVSPSGRALAAAPTGSAVLLAGLDCASTAQEWSFSTSPVANTTYTLVNHQTGWLVDVNGQSTTAGATVIQWDANGGTNQSWRMVASGGGFRLVNGNSNLVLGVGSTGADQETPSGAVTQTWTVKPASAGYYTLTSGGGGGVLASPSATKGAELVVVAPQSGSAAQEWALAASP